ncbi:MAG: fasciclin domain-containing protein [Saprospiraceae bacterium]
MKNLYVLSILIVAMFFSSCGETGEQSSSDGGIDQNELKGQSGVQDENATPNILQVALGSKDHTTLVAGVKAAALQDVLVNAGPLTVFAPTNAAFDGLPDGTLETLLKPENKAVLARIIKFHAAPGSYSGDLLRDGQSLYMASGHNVKIAKDGDKVTVNGANILGTVKASNGIVHLIDAVLLPPEEE